MTLTPFIPATEAAAERLVEEISGLGGPVAKAPAKLAAKEALKLGTKVADDVTDVDFDFNDLPDVEQPNTVDSKVTGTHKWDEPDLNKRINQRGEQGFENGATSFTNAEYVKDGKGVTHISDQTWTIPEYQADKLIHKANSINDIEIGLVDEALGKEAARIDIANPKAKGLGMPTADKGNEYHRPPKLNGETSEYKSVGLTSESYEERLIDSQDISDPDVEVTVLEGLKRDD
ncbi:hypothetical protein [Agarivorans sp. 1_MG-2023]|uniref:hypothetical protein n=1 Tax=Agarivorans sp. 1_MG-2023 TaxID=3062634 RepID=UPI0026E48EB0|nr:hypothetical protein [Agarivorans sp. 1_MG-2023]MDO6763759.1 hypothetical protein [Agarivorans sp. 1_MG-2023]